MTISERTKIALLEDSSEHAMVRMSDGDTFYIAIADAARACLSVDKIKDFAPKFRAFLAALGQWVVLNRPQIKSAYLTIRERDMLFLVMQKGAEFNQELSNSLTDLDISVAQNPDFAMIDMEVLAIPEVCDVSATAFLASGQVLTYAE